jgi:hypothetical protein
LANIELHFSEQLLLASCEMAVQVIMTAVGSGQEVDAEACCHPQI